MAGYYHGTNKATGHQFKANVTHAWAITNDKLSQFFLAMDIVTIIS